ncbi:MAG: IPT/TIG domain-containing protein [Dehalococcoidia bacterium]|jgi:hypothetical protein|nr:IPT/TIG domain-containing protein [Dehalococcoidia bacterium]
MLKQISTVIAVLLWVGPLLSEGARVFEVVNTVTSAVFITPTPTETTETIFSAWPPASPTSIQMVTTYYHGFPAGIYGVDLGVQITAAGFLQNHTYSMATVSNVNTANYGIISDAGYIWSCGDTGMAYVAPGDAPVEVTVSDGYIARVCTSDFRSQTAAIMYEKPSGHYRLCRYAIADLPTATPWSYNLTAACSPELVPAPDLGDKAIGTTARLSVGGSYMSVRDETQYMIFDVEACLAGTTPCYVQTNGSTQYIAPDGPTDYAISLGTTARTGSGTNDFSAYAAELHDLNVSEEATSTIESIYQQRIPRTGAIDPLARMFYGTDTRGILFRIPLDDFGLSSIEELLVCEATGASVHILATLPTDYVVVGCAHIYADAYATMTSVRVADCTAATGMVDCLSDPYYCTWHLYSQECISRQSALVNECVGINATHCIDTPPSFYTVMPRAGPTTGGTTVVITPTVELWSDPTLRCVFGTDDTAVATWDGYTVTCTTPAATLGQTYINLRYKGVDILPPGYGGQLFEYTSPCPPPGAECAIAADCADRYTGNGTCVSAACLNGTCVTALTALHTACATGIVNWDGECDGAGTCVPLPDCTHDDNCTWLYEGSNTCIAVACWSGWCGIDSMEGGACTVDGHSGQCDGYGTCVPDPECMADANCTDRYTGDGVCTYAACRNGTCITGLTPAETACNTSLDGWPGTCSGFGTCVPQPACTHDGNCTWIYGGDNVCVVPVCSDGWCAINPEYYGNCVVDGHNGTCDGLGTCVPDVWGVPCTADSNCTDIYDGNNTCVVAACVGGVCVARLVVAETPCGVGGTCDGAGNCVPEPCTGEPGCATDQDCVDLVAPRHGGPDALGACRQWRCVDSLCTSGLSDEGTACSVAVAGSCTVDPPVEGTSNSGLCSVTGECVVAVDQYVSDQCLNGSSCLGSSCVLVVPGCSTDSDCYGPLGEFAYARGCAAVRCSPDLHVCVNYTKADNSVCVPTDEEAGSACRANQTGICTAGTCELPPAPVDEADNVTTCTSDASCGIARCPADDGACELLTGMALLCNLSALPDACAELTTAMCNGRGYCAWRVSPLCDDGNPCTLDTCDPVGLHGSCRNSPHPTACSGLTTFAAVFGSLVAGSAIIAGIVVAVISFRSKLA